jgi:hypothetical protein
VTSPWFNEKATLMPIRFFWLPDSGKPFNRLISEEKIQRGIVGTRTFLLEGKLDVLK